MVNEAAFKATHSAVGQQNPVSPGPNLPSIFDILAHESLTTSLKPGLKSLSQVLLAASFSENFYGMKRVKLADGTSDFASFGSRIRSLIFLVIVPYLADKIEQFKTKLSQAAPLNRPKLAYWFLRIYPYLKTLTMAICLCTQVLYAFSYSSFPTPFLWLAGVRLERLHQTDLENFQNIPYHLKNGGFFVQLWRTLLSIPSWLSRALSYGLFLVQFFDSFYSSDMSGQFSWNSTSDMANAPTHPANILPESQILTMDVGKCPLCYRERRNDTALCVSGYVFCYSCIYDYVRRERKCPITGIPATTNELIKIYRPTISL